MLESTLERIQNLPQTVKIGFTGTQTGMTPKQEGAVDILLEKLKPTEVHHGDCIGADYEFHDLCKRRQLYIIVHPPKYELKRAFCDGDELREPKDYLDRNHDIVNASDIVVAAPKGPEKLRSGTWATIRYAKKKHIRLFIVWPDGHIE